MARARGIAVLLALVMVAGSAACGSTAQLNGSAGLPGSRSLGESGTASSGGLGPSASAPSALAPSAANPSGGSSSSPAGGGGVLGGGAPVAPAPSGAGALTSTPAMVPTTGRGWDAKYVYIGVTTENDVQSVAKTLNLSGFNAGDTQVQAQSVADYINSRGGVFGRQIKLVFHDENTVSTAEDPATAGNAACTYYTQDHLVVALINPVTLLDGPALRSCMAAAKVPLFSASLQAMDDQADMALAPYFYQGVAVAWNALAPVLVSQLRAQGWFGGWNAHIGAPGSVAPKVGILVNGTDIGSRIGNAIKAALAQAGYAGALVYQYSPPGTQMQPAVLYFAGNGVDHLIAADAELLAFQQNAATQGYHPRYGVTTYNAPVTDLALNSPVGQNDGALGVGWAPTLDVDDGNDPGITGPGERNCLAMNAKSGQTFAGLRLAAAVAFAICDGMLLVSQGAVAGGGLTSTAIYQGMMRIAPTFSTALSFATGLSPTQPFVPGAVRGLAWVGSCTCFRYTTPATRV
jgi:ABC-type branched-subunit amino acid transport system substrate-binding protein